MAEITVYVSFYEDKEDLIPDCNHEESDTRGGVTKTIFSVPLFSQF